MIKLPAPGAPRSARLLPALIATGAVLLGLKAVALAEEASHAAEQPSATPAHAAAAPGQEGGEAPAASCPAPSFAEQAGLSQAEVQVLQALGARRQALDARAGTLDTDAQLLTVAERRLDERLTELRRLEASVGALLGQLDEQSAARVANLVDVYQRMRAKDAAAIFDTLDEDTLVLVASRMRQQNLAEVMGRMEPARARLLTQRLAELARATRDAQAVMGASAPQGGASPAAPRAAPTP